MHVNMRMLLNNMHCFVSWLYKTNPITLHRCNMTTVTCHQCGIHTYPHTQCRCIQCGVIHRHNGGCQRVRFCHQCGQTVRTHTICDCQHCGRRHQISQVCRVRRAPRTFKAAMRGVIPDVSNVGSMDQICPFCGALSWQHETMNCCSQGAIQLPTLAEPPLELAAIIQSSHVQLNSRAYNMSLSMASVGHQNKGLPDGWFILGGRSYHRIGGLIPSEGNPHTFAQIYMLDPDAASDRRMGVFGGDRCTLRRDVLRSLHELLMLHNPWARQFAAAARDGAPRLVWRCTDDITTMQIGAMITEVGSRRDVVVTRLEGPLMHIHDGHALYHPLAYPLLFPLGTVGWQEDMIVASVDFLSQRRVTLTEWGRFHLMHRGTFTHLQRCQKLTLEFYCDLFAQVESRNADFHRMPQQQSKYRAARVMAVEDQLNAGIHASEIGKAVVRLPSGFVGSARYYQQLYYDAMALPRRFGKPDLFITMTCNPKWNEITAAIPAGSHWKHHPEIVDRVFMLKLKEFIRDITECEIFGEVKAYVWRIEWQARGLPHCHMLFILKDKILSVRHIDAIVSAEMPDPIAEPELSALVVKHMLHPFCDTNTKYGCRQDKNGKVCDCRRFYPKVASATTVIVADGFPMYIRRCNNTVKMSDGRIVTDNWVVPHNKYVCTVKNTLMRSGHIMMHAVTICRYLLLKYKCHINVEVCAHFRCFKYVYKYTFKAPDRTAIAVDEIDAHFSGRLLSVSEAVHRLHGLPLHKEFPSVMRLDIHLPRQHTMVFDPTADEDTLLNQTATTVSTLMGWFELNAVDPQARQYLYHEIPEHYTWKDQSWHRRLREVMAVGRIYIVSHHNSELFALRRLLKVIKGATSFQDMATYDGVLHTSFMHVCRARGLVLDDEELVLTFRELAETEISVQQLRRLFASLIVNGAPTDAPALFNQFVDDLCEGSVDDDAIADALYGIEECMAEIGKTLTTFGFELPSAQLRVMEQLRLHQNAQRRTTNVTSEVERDRYTAMFTAEQHSALTAVIQSIGNIDQCNVFALLASAGCGKTVFANGLATTLRCRNRIVVSVAASALAAMLLLGGCTAHSYFHIPIPANEYTMCNLSQSDRRILRSADVILYDECSMVHQDIADTVDRSMRDITNDDRPFGGKTIVFMGDFKQLLPVVRHGKGHNFTMQRCSWWKKVRILTLNTNWRAVQHPEYSRFLEDVGNGRIDKISVPVERIVHSFAEMIDVVYGNNFPENHQILALTLETCAEINTMCIAKLDGDMIEVAAVDIYVDCANPDDFPPDYVESVHMNGAPPFMLNLKVGARFMCIRNLNAKRGLINGTLLKILDVSQRFIQCQILSGPATGGVEILLKCVFTISPEASGLPFTITRRQYPIIPAYCLSVHKAQGQTIKFCGLIFESDPFTHGQLYVALSRVACWDCLVVLLHSGETHIHNCVLKHLIS